MRNLLTTNKILIVKCCESQQQVFSLHIMSHPQDFRLNKSILRKKEEDMEDSDKGNNFQEAMGYSYKETLKHLWDNLIYLWKEPEL
ncbi:hypothetical protein CDAR_100131 [Caerostris darwini]|uniref:Uncharacterized protein n=1 Tax=Caerostris darwini TaxID=1538125 RepID=A0AAV4QF02_9ARAC|nr:hypothetical protein CDAR_100131 [Caerostris darwini]